MYKGNNFIELIQLTIGKEQRYKKGTYFFHKQNKTNNYKDNENVKVLYIKMLMYQMVGNSQILNRKEIIKIMNIIYNHNILYISLLLKK